MTFEDKFYGQNSLWTDIQDSLYFDALVSAIASHIGRDTAAELGSVFNLTNIETIRLLVEGAGFTGFENITVRIDLDLPPVETFVPCHISATPMEPGYTATPMRYSKRYYPN